ncbi:MAG: hypothetical protein Q8918_17910 [Bacteroidota bacterium]|nr:hypothetical protein [Bacteroidota bacterium]MDP4213886.1 hypothetical protein [Bacteroidota bacterium]MDP4251980.1 hypothetical protein [Bacteroidota bacterium]
MTNAKISPRAQKVLRNKKLSAAIATALAKNSHASARGGVILKAGNESLVIRTASAQNAVKK